MKQIRGATRDFMPSGPSATSPRDCGMSFGATGLRQTGKVDLSIRAACLQRADMPHGHLSRKVPDSMRRRASPVSTEQVRAFVELARCGSMRLAARELCLSEEGLRSRLLALEARLRIDLYEKKRGRYTTVQLTPAGQAFLGKAERFIEEARILSEFFEPAPPAHQIKIAVSEHLMPGVGAIVRDFHAQYPGTAIRLSTRTDREVVSVLQQDASYAAGICTPDEYPTELAWHRWLAMESCLLAPADHPLVHRSSVTLAELADQPLMIPEPGSGGRQHILEAFHQRGLAPRIVADVTSGHAAAALVEAGLGIAVVPMLPTVDVARGVGVARIPIGDSIRPAESGVLSRPGAQVDPMEQAFLDLAFRWRVPEHALATPGKQRHLHAVI